MLKTTSFGCLFGRKDLENRCARCGCLDQTFFLSKRVLLRSMVIDAPREASTEKEADQEANNEAPRFLGRALGSESFEEADSI